MSIATVLGTRPELVKMAPVISLLVPVFFTGWVFFHLAETRISERI